MRALDAILSDTRVGVAVGCGEYDASAPFSPDERYAEYPFGVRGDLSPRNRVYGLVREALRQAGMDAERFGTSAWNPLGLWIGPGQTVVLKPNFVREFRESSADHANCLITHGSIIRAVVDYVYLALRGEGRIIIADAPHNDADFEVIRRISGLAELASFYEEHAKFGIEVRDLRPERAEKVDGVIVGHRRLAGDPSGYVRVNLGDRSAFYEVNDLCHLLYGSEYDMSELHRHQQGEVHEYLISKTVLQADCVISLPKLKTHKKVGLTVNMKNLVGINGNKNWLPHHREGMPSRGGDQFPDDRWVHRVERVTVGQFKRAFPWLGPLRPLVAGPIKSIGKRVFGDTNKGTIRSGNWYGNDTTWRMVVDLNRILFYADAAGVVHDRPFRRVLSVVDGVVGGEGNGPLDPTPKSAGLVLAGGNPVAVDLSCARLMGFDAERLPVLRRVFDDHSLPLRRFGQEDVCLHSGDGRFDGRLGELAGACLSFVPHFGWRGHIELAGEEVGSKS